MPDFTVETHGYCAHLYEWMNGPDEVHEATEPLCNWTTDGSPWKMGDRCPACGAELKPMQVLV
jgi:hypothetical protein